MRVRPGKAWAAGIMALLATGCTVGPDFHRPRPSLPPSWPGTTTPAAGGQGSISEPVGEPITPDWWAAFNDPELTSLEHRVAAANLDLRTATIRLAESRAMRRITSAAAFPQVHGNATYQRQKPSEKGIFSLFGAGAGGSAAAGGGIAGPTGVPTAGTGLHSLDLWQYGFDSQWELDLWGRVRRSVEAADAAIEESADARRDALISVLAEVARDYLLLRGTQTKLRISKENLAIAEDSLMLTTQRATGGLSSQLDVATADAQVATTKATIPPLQQSEAQAIDRLSFLLGRPPGSLAAELATPHPVPPPPPRVPVGLPAELARRRPDIRQAEAQLHAQTAEVGVAVASFYPNVTLSAMFDLQALKFSDLGSWQSRTATLGPTLSLPLFDGGQLAGNLQLTKARQQEAAVAYQRTVLNAWREVVDALVAYEAEQQRREAIASAVERNRRRLRLAREQYRQGLVSFLQVLTAEQQLLASERQEAGSTTAVSTDLVALYKALGGGWETSFPTGKSGKQ